MAGYVLLSIHSEKNNAVHTHVPVHTNTHANLAYAQLLQKLRVSLLSQRQIKCILIVNQHMGTMSNPDLSFEV